MSSLQAFLRGLRHSGDQLGLVGWLWLVNLLFALPAGVLMVHTLQDSIGPSLVQENLRQGFDMDWYGEVEAKATGVMKTFRPETVVGMGPLLKNLEGWLTGGLFVQSPALLGLVLLFLLAWILLQGGVLIRLHDPLRPKGLGDLLSAGGEVFFPMLRLAVVSAPLYYLVYRLGRWGLGKVAHATRDTTEETTALAYALVVTTGVVLMLLLVRLVFDYAKMAVVIENRRSALGAALRGAGFVLTHPGKTFLLVLLASTLTLLLGTLYSVVGPGVGTAGRLGLGLGFAVQQLYLIARILVRITLLGGQIELYKAHRLV